MLRLCVAVVALCVSLVHAQCVDVNWAAENAPVPPARSGAAMVWDSARHRLVLFGGQLGDGSLSNTTWEFDGTAWQQVAPTSSPSARTGHAMVFDSGRNVVVLFGGCTNLAAPTYSSATWEYNGSTWTQRSTVTTPSARMSHAMAFDSSRGRVVMFGGRGVSGLLANTFEYDGTDWQQLATGTPSARDGAAMAYDASREVTVLHGGRTSIAGDTYDGTTWEWSGAGWNLATNQGLGPRAGHCMVFDASRLRMVVFGGCAPSATFYNLTWEYDGASWIQRSPGTTPSARAASAGAFDPIRARMIISGGSNSTTISAETWELTATSLPLPTFSQHPASQQLNPDNPCTFHAALSAGGTVTWLWKRNGQPLLDGTHVAGSTTDTLTIHAVSSDDAGNYTVEATNSCGTRASNAASLSLVPPCGSADFNGDGDVGTDADIEAFFRVLAGGHC